MKHLFCLILALGLLVFSFVKLAPAPASDDIVFVPQASYVRTLSAGHRESVATLFWTKALTSMGELSLEGKDFALLNAYADIVTSLDSSFFMPYYFVGSMAAGTADTSDLKILERGIKAYPEDWRLSLFLALRYTQLEEANYSRAAEIMRAFENEPKAPEHIRRIWRSFEIKAQPTEVAVLMLAQDWQTAPAQFKGAMENKMLDYLHLDKEKRPLLQAKLESIGKNPQLAPTILKLGE